jgi:uncharacterized protein YjiK
MDVKYDRLPVPCSVMAPCVLLLLLVLSCSSRVQYKNPPHYDLHKGKVIKLPEELNEISGLAYYAKDKSLFTESDEQGDIYKISLDHPRDIKRWKFQRKRDYEDIVLVDSTFYVLNSSGDIYAVRFTHDSIASVKYDFPIHGQFNEFESLYFDPVHKKLVMLCKECKQEVKTDNDAYLFDPTQAVPYSKLYTIDSRKAIDASTQKSAKFKPSAAAIHPLSGDLYIISSVNKVLVIASADGEIKEVYPIDPAMFRHPEGLAFDPAGNMYISNEAEELSPANILFFEYKKDAK